MKSLQDTVLPSPQTIYPCTHAQQRMVIAQLRTPDSTRYNVPFRVHLPQLVDLPRLIGALQELAKRHPSFRTRFLLDGSQVRQYFVDAFTFDHQETLIEPAQLETCFCQFIRPFDLQHEAPIRVKLVKVGQSQHFLFIDAHHSVFDAGSYPVLIGDLAALYAGEALPKIDAAGLDFAAWQQSDQGQAQAASEQRYWLDRFTDVKIERLDLPCDHHRNSNSEDENFVGAVVGRTMPQSLHQSLRRLSKNLQVPLHCLLLAAYNVLLYRFTNQHDIIVGHATHGRTRHDLEKQVGMFVNLYALPTRVDGGMRLSALIHAQYQALQGIHANPNCQIGELADALGLTGVNALFNVSFNYLRIEPTISDFRLHTPCFYPQDQARDDLQFNIENFGSSLELAFIYKTSLFESATIERLLSAFLLICQAIADNCDQYIGQIDILTKNERQQVLRDFNRTRHTYDHRATYFDDYLRHVALAPQKIALLYNDQQLSYGELHAVASHYANQLEASQVGRGDCVAILAEPGFERIALILACHMLGASYLGLLAEIPDDRMQFMLDDSQVKALAVSTAAQQHSALIRSLCQQHQAMSCYLAPAWSQCRGGEHRHSRPSATDHAYIIYTSGTTGKPKGIPTRHQALNNYLGWLSDYSQFSSAEISTHFCSFSFDPSVQDITLPLRQGATVSIIPDDVRKDVSALTAYIEQHRCTVLLVTTKLGELLMDNLPGSIRCLILGGEALKKTFRDDRVTLINLCGPTECAIAAVGTVVEANAQQITIGKPIYNSNSYVLDENRQPLPVGVTGEWYIAGDCVADGYLNRDDLSAEKFIANPFTSVDAPYPRMYATGDLVSWGDDGKLRFHGRKDFQIKIRGYRIEIKEIEYHLLRYPGITSALVLALEQDGDHYLCAYYEAANDIPMTALRQHLSQSLPDYMLPDSFVWQRHFPLTLNGKIDRRALPMPKRATSSEAYQPPRNETERLICEAFRQTLALDKVGIHDDFVMLGGHSLKAIMLVAQLQQHLNVRLSDVFKLRTPARLAGLKTGQVSAIEAQPPRACYPLSTAQERIFVTHQLEPDSTRYNISLCLRIDRNIDRERLGKAIDALVARHSILRSNYRISEGVIQQSIAPAKPLQKTFLSASEAEVPALFAKFIRPFVLESDTLVRASLVKISASLHYLFLDFHHIVFDGGSLLPMLDELQRHDNGEPIEPLAISYVDFAIWQREGAGAERVKEQQDYWQQRFGSVDIEPLNLPLDAPRLAGSSQAGARYQVQLSQALTRQLAAQADSLEISLGTLLFGAYVALWYRYTNQKEIIVGNVIAGRERAELSTMLGMFVNTVPVLTHVDGQMHLAELLQAKQEDLLQVIEHQSYPMEALADYLGLSGRDGRNPLFDVVFNYLELPSQVGLFELMPDHHAYDQAKFDLLLNVENDGRQITLNFSYKTALFHRPTIERMATAFVNICQAIAENPAQPLKDIDILSASQRQKLLVEFNQTKLLYDTSRTYFDDYLQQVRDTPNKTLLIFNQQRLSFAQLHALASHYTDLLLAHQIKAGDYVAILAEPGIERIAMIVACHMLGAGYVPMLSEMPLERLQFIANDSAARLIVTVDEEYLRHQALIDALIADSHNSRLLRLDDYHPHLDTPLRMDLAPHPEDIAYIIYTSGTTGNPKGSPISHFSLNNYLIWHADYFNVGAEDTCVQFAGFSFDASVIDIYLPLKTGAAMCIVPDGIRKDLNALRAYLTRHHATVAFFPTKLGELLMDDMPEGFRCLVLGGEELKKTFKDERIQLGNICAPSECTVAMVGTYIEPGCQNITMGRPIYNSRSYVLDENMQPAPLGVAGEWYIAGYGVANGYINRPELTAEKFLPNPFVSTDDQEYHHYARLYKTGDMVCWTEDGKIKYLGRKDFQVKIRGYRIEIEDIEFHLHSYPDINGIIVLAREDQSSKYLCAYYEAKQEIDSALLRSHLAQSVPAYMIPDYFVWLPAFPMTLNGKIDRRALPIPDRAALASEYVAPRSEQEQLICNEFVDVLELAQVGIHDDFFTLGGNSLKAIRLISRLQENFKINVADVFKYRTPEALAAHVAFVRDHLRSKLEQIKQSFLTTPQPVASMPLDDEAEVGTQSLHQKSIETVLLTGSTGYLGCHLLERLLTQTEYKVCLLVRAQDAAGAWQRLEACYASYFADGLNAYRTRLQVLTADIEQADLALTAEQMAALQRNVDSIIHCAALVKHYGHYDEFQRANVTATGNLLELARRCRGHDFHYISTESVLRDGHVPGKTHCVFDESSDGSEIIDRENYYIKTKYEGEQLCRRYRQHGVNCNIYRIGNQSMHSTRFYNQANIEDNGFFTRVKAMLNLGITAHEIALSEISPVDCTALAIVRLFDKEELSNRTYHVFNPRICDLADLFDDDPDLNIKTVSIIEFIDDMLEKINLSTYRKFIELFMLHAGWLQNQDEPPTSQIEVQQLKTERILRSLGFQWPRIRLEMLSDLIRRAFAERLALLQQSMLMTGINESLQLAIAKSMQLNHYRQDSLITQETERQKNIKFILDGFVDNYTVSGGDWVSTIQLLSGSDVINLETIAGKPASISSKAIFDAVSTLEIDADELENLFNNDAKLYRKVIAHIIEDKTKIQHILACCG